LHNEAPCKRREEVKGKQGHEIIFRPQPSQGEKEQTVMKKGPTTKRVFLFVTDGVKEEKRDTERKYTVKIAVSIRHLRAGDEKKEEEK